MGRVCNLTENSESNWVKESPAWESVTRADHLLLYPHGTQSLVSALKHAFLRGKAIQEHSHIGLFSENTTFFRPIPFSLLELKADLMAAVAFGMENWIDLGSL